MRKDRVGRLVPNRLSIDKPANRFWDHVDHDELKDALAGNDKYSTFLRSFQDTAYIDLSFPARLAKFDITLHECQVMYSEYKRHMGLMKMSSDLPQIMSDVSSDAKNRMILCPRCEGNQTIEVKAGKTGKRTTTKTCPECEGEGRVLERGDKHARDLVFNSMGLVKQGGPLVAINQNFGTDSNMDSKMESMMKLTQQIVMGERKEEEPV